MKDFIESKGFIDSLPMRINCDTQVPEVLPFLFLALIVMKAVSWGGREEGRKPGRIGG